MGRLVSQEIQHLVGGVSQQAPGMRLPTQCEAQRNCWNSVVSGMGIRPGTKRVGSIGPVSQGAFTMDYRRDRHEFYKIVLANDGDQNLKVFDAKKGHEYPVVFSDGLLEAKAVRRKADGSVFSDVPYLRPQDDRSYREAFQLLPIADSLLLVNRTYPVSRAITKEQDVPDSQTSDVRFRINIKTLYGPSYFPDLAWYTYRHPWMVDYTDVPTSGYIFKVNGLEYHYKLWASPTGSEIAARLAKDIQNDNPSYSVFIIDSTLYVTVPLGDDMTFVDESRVIGDHDGWDVNTSPQKYTRYDVNVTTVTSETLDPTKATDGRPKSEAIAWVKRADYATNYVVTIDGTAYTHKTPESTTDQARDGLRTEAIAEALAQSIAGTVGLSAFARGNVIHVTSDADFTISSTDSLGDTALVAFKREVNSEAGLPGNNAPTGYKVRVRGAVDQPGALGYWLRYDVSAGGNGVWYEDTALDSLNKFNLKSMPLLLTRRQDFERITEANPYGIYFELATTDWQSRAVGDDNSAPFPTFCSKQNLETGAIENPRSITAACIHHNRLLLVSQDTITVSEIGKFFNLFPTTTAVITDSDPFEVTIDTNSVLNIRHATPMAGAVLLWDDREQHVLKSDAVFTANTVYSSMVSAKGADLSLEPLRLDNRGLFLTKRGRYYGAQEIYASDGVDVFQTTDISAQIPEYLSGHIKKMVGNTENNLVLLLSDKQGEDGRSNLVYVYNYFDEGDERVQSAWSSWAFGAEVLDISIDGTTILLTVKRQTGTDIDGNPVFETFLETMELSYDETEQTHGHAVYLDSYVSSEAEPLDADLYPGELKKQVGSLWYRGFLIDVMYEFSPFIIRERDNTALSEGRLQLKRLLLTYYETTNFTIEVETLSREVRELSFQGRVLGRLDNIIGKVPVTSGRFSAPIMGRSGAIKVRIRNREIYGFKFQSAVWEGFFNSRSKRI